MNVCEYSPLLRVCNSLGKTYRATIEKTRTGEIRGLFFIGIVLFCRCDPQKKKNKTKSRTADSLVYEVIIHINFCPLSCPPVEGGKWKS